MGVRAPKPVTTRFNSISCVFFIFKTNKTHVFFTSLVTKRNGYYNKYLLIEFQSRSIILKITTPAYNKVCGLYYIFSFFDVRNSLTNSSNVFCLIVWNLNIKFFSNSIISSTVSNESAPKSLVKLASVTTSFSSTPNLSTIIALLLMQCLT
jgi:hypothetical protein